MAEDPNARPVSGEIMAGEGALPSPRPAASDVVDAEFETLGDARASAPREPARIVAIGTAGAPMVGLSMLKSGEMAGTSKQTKGGPAFWIFGLAVASGAFWVSGGHALVRQPETALAVTEAPAGGFRIEGLTSRVEDAGGRLVLFVDGGAVNGSGQPAVAPPLEIIVVAKSGRATRYKLGTSREPLDPGARFSFSSRLEAPTDGVKSVSVDFSEIE